MSFSSDSHLLNIDLTTDQYSTHPTPNRVDHPLIVNDTHVNSPRQDPRFLYLATHKLNSNPNISNECRRKELQRLDTKNLEIKFEIAVKFHNLSPHPIPSHTTVNFKSLPHPFMATNLSLFVSDQPRFRLLHGSITFLNTLTYPKYTAQFELCLLYLFALSSTSSLAFTLFFQSPFQLTPPLIMLILMILIFLNFWFPIMIVQNNTI